MSLLEKFYKNPTLYVKGLKLLGYERSLEAFVRKHDLLLPKEARLYEIGCGSGVLGRTLLKIHPDANLLITDIEPGLLHEAEHLLMLNNIKKSRFETGISNADRPRTVTTKAGTVVELPDSSFDLVIIGAVLGHTKNYEQTLDEVSKLLKPRGYMLIIEMSNSLPGKIVSYIYNYKNLKIKKMINYLRENEFSVSKTKLSYKYFPVNLTRISLVAQKP